MSTETLPLTDYRITALARTVCEIDPGARHRFDVAVVLEAVGHNDRTAREAGWPDLFALAQAVAGEIDFLQTDEERAELLPLADQTVTEPRYAIGAMVVQQAAWLLMIAVTFLGGLSVWAAEVLPASLERALAVGILGSLVLSGGFQFASARRLVFHIFQHDLVQGGHYLRRLLTGGTIVMAAGAFAVGLGLWLASDRAPLAPALGAAYFFLHGNYRIALMPLVVIEDLAGILLSLAGAVGLLLLTYAVLLHAGLSPAAAGVASQLAALLMLWLASSVRASRLIRPERAATPFEPETPRGAHGVFQPRRAVLILDALPWLAAGLLYYTFLFGTRPLAWTLPRAQRLAYESGFDLGIIGIIPAAVIGSWLLHLFYREWRSRLVETTVGHAGALPDAALARFNLLMWRCRLWGIAAALLLVGLSVGAARLAGLPPETVAVLQMTLGGTAALLPGLLFACGLLLSLAALPDVIGILLGGLAVQLGLGVLLARLDSAMWLPPAFFVTAAVFGEVAVWRARRAVRRLDWLYYAAF